MNLFESLLIETGSRYSTNISFLSIKITAIMAVAWLLHFALYQANPRWRVLAWRASTVGILLLAALAISPPLVKLPMLPPAAATNEPQLTHIAPVERVVTGERLDARENRSVVAKPLAESDANRVAASRGSRTNTRSQIPGIPSESTLPQREAKPWNWARWLTAIYLVGVLFGLMRAAFALRRLVQIRNQATDASEWVAMEIAKVAEALGVRRKYRVGQSASVQSPCLISVLQPMILLPADQCKSEFAAELPSIAAHELAHLRGHDLEWNSVLSSLATLLWFHPLAWRMRAAHADTCDDVSDAIAADYIGDGAYYGSTLARLALRIHRPAATVGLAMARPSGIRRRVEAIQRHVFRYALPRRWAVLSLSIAAAVCVLLGGLTITRTIAEQQNDKPSTEKAATDKPVAVEPAKGRMTIHTVADESGVALPGATLEFHGTIGGQRIKKTLTTDADGNAQLEWKSGARIDNLWMTARKPKMVPVHYNWQPERNEIVLPERLDLSLKPGRKIGGVVRDEAGQPLHDANVEVSMPITWPRLASHVFTAAELKTDANGRWQFGGAPADAPSVSITVKLADYMVARGGAKQTMDNVTVLQQGLKVAGTIVDKDQKPIAGAKAALGFDRWGSDDPDARTDVQGHFVLKNCKPGPSLVTAQADGFAPQAKEIVVGEKNEDLKFVLEPGHALKVRVVDVKGKPVKGAFFAADTWRGYRSVDFRRDSPADGRITWPSAPPDTVLCDLGKNGYMSARQVPLKAGGEEQTVTLYPELVINGRVTDSRTGEPVKDFQVTHGYQFRNGGSQTSWSRDAAIACKDGQYTYKFDEPMKGYFVQVAARGYRPATSRMFETTEGKVRYDFALESGEGPAGVVLLPDGKPAAGAQVGIAMGGKRAQLRMGRFDPNQNDAQIVTTDDLGHFSFLPQTDPNFALFILHDAGFAQVMSDELSKSQTITLAPWGRIEGRVLLGAKPDANREVSFQPHMQSKNGKSLFSYIFSYGYDTRTDQDGHFVLDRVIPGKGSIARVLITEFLKSQEHAPGWHQSIEVHPGETANVTIGGTGRPVTGKVVLDRDPGVAIDWPMNEPAGIDAWDKKKGERDRTFRRYLGNVDKSGRFTIPDVPAGDYKLVVPVNNPPVPNACGAGDEIGKAEFAFTVPAMPGGRSDEPLDLGQITAKMFDSLDVGELAPDFVAERLDGGQLQLAELQGKVVLLDFWATWCGPCIAEMPTLKEIQQKHVADNRFALVSVSCDDDPASAKKVADDNGLSWLHVNVKGTQSKVPRDYTVRALPATFLIGPNGQVIAKNLRGDELKQAVAAVLADESLFQKTGASRPARFPVAHFDAPAETPAAVDGAVVVADDSDPNFEKDKPHTDGARLLAADGHELWSATGLNNCQDVGGKGVAIDRQRGRIYVRENVARRITAFNPAGRKLWQMESIGADTLLVDEKTGNLWTSGGPLLDSGETVVFDHEGKELAAYPFRGVDMAYDPHTDAFWLVGYELLKVGRDGKILFRKRVDGWCCRSVSVNTNDGSVWIAESDHPDIPTSKNRLWLLNSDGGVRRELDLGEDGLWVITCDPKSGNAWLAGRKMRSVTPAGKFGEPLDIEAHNIVISPTTGDLWVNTDDAVLRIDRTGKILAKSPHRAKSQQAWIAAF